MNWRTLAAPAAALTFLALAGCGATTPAAGTAGTSTAAPAASPAASIMVVSDPTTIGAYQPQSTQVKVGDTVQWTFVDKNPHTVTADDQGFDSKEKSNGQVFAQVFSKAGTYAYHCDVHPEMHGTIVVAP